MQKIGFMIYCILLTLFIVSNIIKYVKYHKFLEQYRRNNIKEFKEIIDKIPNEFIEKEINRIKEQKNVDYESMSKNIN